MLPWVPTVVVGEPLPVDPQLVDQRGHALRWSRLAGHAFAVTFVYTRCRESAECPATSAKFARLQQELPANAHLLELTIDPAFDRSAVLRRYGALFGADPSRWTIATGDPQTVLTLAERFNVTVAPGRVPGTLEHGEAIAVFDTRERLVSLTRGNSWQPREILAELQSASGGSGNLFDRLTLWFRNFGLACGAVLTASTRLARPIGIAAVVALFTLVAGASFVVLRALRQYLAR
jgi:cytochrome oxidase Cu insertion factor (SCO1/SenC/PrrC family)